MAALSFFHSFILSFIRRFHAIISLAYPARPTLNEALCLEWDGLAYWLRETMQYIIGIRLLQ